MYPYAPKNSQYGTATWKDFAILLSGNIAAKTWLIFEVAELLLKPELTDFNDHSISAFRLAELCIVKSTI